MIKVIGLVSVIIIAVSILVFVLIRRIITPFTQLADWVREVGKGNVDQDEFDIDTSDELGEIAQAFKEMTTKFREAQVGLIEQQRLQKELQVAQEIQHMLLPQDFPQVKGGMNWHPITRRPKRWAETSSILWKWMKIPSVLLWRMCREKAFPVQ